MYFLKFNKKLILIITNYFKSFYIYIKQLLMLKISTLFLLSVKMLSTVFCSTD